MNKTKLITLSLFLGLSFLTVQSQIEPYTLQQRIQYSQQNDFFNNIKIYVY